VKQPVVLSLLGHFAQTTLESNMQKSAQDNLSFMLPVTCTNEHWH